MKLSIITPTYNRLSQLKRCIKSVKSQSFQNWEHVIIDDGSTDETKNYLQQQAKKDNRIKPVFLKTNQGVSVARNTGAEHASGEWLCFLDSDDEYLPNAFSVISKEIENLSPKADVIQFMLQVEDKARRYRWGYKPEEKWDYFYPSYPEVVVKDGITRDLHRCIKKDIFDHKRNMFSPYRFGLEFIYYAGLAKQGYKFAYVNKDVELVHRDSNMHLSNQSPKVKNHEFAKAYKSFFRDHDNALKLYPKKRRQHILAAIQSSLSVGDISLIPYYLGLLMK